jgi:superoxide dismutase, Fe-Mn family
MSNEVKSQPRAAGDSIQTLSSPGMTRREIIGAIAAGGSAVLISTASRAQAAGAAPAAAGGVGKHAPVPLPFDPKSLKGLSEKLIVSHHDNNYAGALKNLNKVEEELARVNKDTPGFIVGGLKERELTFTNSGILHEHYFGNLGGNGKATGPIQKAISDAFGSFAHFEESFRATGMSLAGGSGWTILAYNLHAGALQTYWSGNHTQALAFGQPLLVMDMYEHAYQMDYGAAAAKYVDAFFTNIRWEEVNRRYERAERAAAVLKA